MATTATAKNMQGVRDANKFVLIVHKQPFLVVS
jgi:hypothetical protein